MEHALVEIETDTERDVVLVDGIVFEQRADVVFGVQRNFLVTDVGTRAVDEIVDIEVAFGFLFDFIAVFVFEFEDLFRLDIRSEITAETDAETFVCIENHFVVFHPFFGEIEFEVRRDYDVDIPET